MTVASASPEAARPHADDERDERAEPAGDPRRWSILVVLCLALLVVGIDGTIVNVALPTLVRELGASTSQLQWIVDAYTIVFASLLLICGNTGDRLGRKRCFVAGMVVFGAGSFACSQVSSPESLILFRGVQGFGAALIMPATLSILTNVFRDDAERARAIALWAGVSGLGVALGPLAGGFLLEHFWWGSIFLVNVPLVAVAIVAALLVVPESLDPHAPRLDLVGTVLSAVGLLSLLYAIIEGPNDGWGDPVIVGAFVAAVVLLGGFVVWERHTDHPLLDIGFFSNPRFTAASLAITFVFFAMFGSLFFVSQYLQFVLGYSALKSGVCLIPVAAALMVSAPLSARLVDRQGTKRVVTFGLVLVALALLLFSRVTDTSGYPLVGAVLVIIGLGMGFAMAPATDSIMGSLPPEKAGVGSAMNDTTREIGGALGVAIMGSLTASAYAANITAASGFAQLEQASPEAAAAVRDSIGGAALVAEQVPGDVGAAIQQAANDAFINALDHAVVIAALVAFGGALIAYLFLPARAQAAGAKGAGVAGPPADVEGAGAVGVAVAAEDADGDRSVDGLVAGAARRVGGADLDRSQRDRLARTTLGLLADAGMSSLTYNAISARSGVGTATLQRYWTSHVDAVTDALSEVYSEHAVPDTGDLAADLRGYLSDLAEVLAQPRTREVLGAVIAEASTDPELGRALRERVGRARRAALAERLSRGPSPWRWGSTTPSTTSSGPCCTARC